LKILPGANNPLAVRYLIQLEDAADYQMHAAVRLTDAVYL
jgi:hypothetical protein